MNAFIAALSGLVFGIGLLLAGMANPMKVKAFLDLAGAWDPSLALVMAGAIAVAMGAFAIARQRSRSWTGATMEIPTDRRIDTRLVLGGVLFGTGWGIAGFCPGPALVALGSGMGAAFWFVPAMLAGMLLHDQFGAPR